jgi:hypothetical protein
MLLDERVRQGERAMSFKEEPDMRKTAFHKTVGRLGLIGVLGGLLTAVAPVRGQAQDRAVTFAKDVAPIFQEKCQGCHRPGQMGPMALVTYQDTRPWVRSIRAKVAGRVMPPWHLDKTVGIQKFKNDISLTDREIDTIVRWVDQGAQQGDPKDMPAPKQWPSADVWHLADSYGRPPDLIVKSTPWTQAPEGQDQWWQPVVDTGLTEDRWVKGIEIRPSSKGRRIVHHVVTNLVQQEEQYGAVDVPGAGGYFSEFAVGKIGDMFRENTGKLMKAGSKIRFDIHYHSVGEQLTDSSEVAVWFYPKGEVPKYRVFPQAMGVQQSMATLDIPPGKVTQHFAYIPLTRPARLENFQPHMHVRGKAMSFEAIYPDGRVEILNSVDHFDFNWHVNYVYADDVAPVLPKGTVLKITAWHDNTAANPANPDPTQWVGWGQRSFDDMYHAHVNVTYLTDEDFDQITRERKQAAAKKTSAQQ